ncbi:MAG: hypothetical protein ACK2T3_07180 [Candidatus Promineifilaceae bacterium]|jgi:hypothetical protein
MNSSEVEQFSRKKERQKLILVIVGSVLIAAAIAMATLSIVGYLAYQQAQEQREKDSQQALLDEVERQMSMARDDYSDGLFQRSLMRLDWVIEHDPDHEGAAQLQREVLSQMELALTPEATVTSTVEPTPTRAIDVNAEPEAIFSEIENLMQDEQWLTAISRLTEFQFHYPDYSRYETDMMLFDANINIGLDLLQGDQIELGLYYLGQAEKLGNLPEEVSAFQTWAELYLLGIGYFGVDWGQAIYYFRGLCSAAPYYQDSCTRLYDSLVAYGDIYATILEWCPAEELYFEAVLYDANEELSLKLDEASEKCQEATPTPTATATVPAAETPTSAGQ